MKKVNLNILIPTILISIIGIVTLFSSQTKLELSSIVIKQIIFVIIGIVVFLLSQKIDLSILKLRPVVLALYIFTILLLVLTLIFGQSVYEAKRWINFAGIQLQPSEIAKLTIVFTTAYVFTLKDKYKEWILILVSLGLTVPIVALIYIQPHGSMALISLFLWFVTTFVCLDNQLRNIVIIGVFGLIFLGLFLFTIVGNSWYLLISLIGIIISIFAFYAKQSFKFPLIIAVIASLIIGGSGSLIWNSVLSQYQRNRVIAFIDPASNSKDIAFNVEQSKIAIGSGGWFGKGFANGTQSRLNFLPFHETDFIFASYAQSYGFIGCIVLISLYLYIFIYIFKHPLLLPHETFSNIIIVVLGLKILLEFFINLGTNIGITPATGIPLPLMSAGGTITIITFFSLGLIQGIINSVREKNMYKLNG